MDGRRIPAAASSDGQLDASARIWFQFVCMGLLSLNDFINVELIPPLHVDAGMIVVVVVVSGTYVQYLQGRKGQRGEGNSITIEVST